MVVDPPVRRARSGVILALGVLVLFADGYDLVATAQTTAGEVIT